MGPWFPVASRKEADIGWLYVNTCCPERWRKFGDFLGIHWLYQVISKKSSWTQAMNIVSTISLWLWVGNPAAHIPKINMEFSQNGKQSIINHP